MADFDEEFGNDEFDDGFENDFDLEFGETDFMGEEQIDERTPVMSRVKAGVNDFKSEFSIDDNPSLIKDMLKASLPSEIRVVTDGIGEIEDSIEDSWDKHENSLKSTAYKLADLVDNIVPNNSFVRGITSSIKGMSKIDSSYSDYRTEEDIYNEDVQNKIGSLFVEQQGRSDLTDSIHTSLMLDSGEKTNKLLLDVATSLRANDAYNNSMTTSYYKRSLELQYKHLFVAKQQFKMLSGAMEMQTSLLNTIIHNTALPDLVKVRSSEALIAAGRNQLGAELSKTLFNADEENWVTRITKRIKQGADEASAKVMEVGDFAEGLSGNVGGLSIHKMVAMNTADRLKYIATDKVEQQLAKTKAGQKIILEAQRLNMDPAEYLQTKKNGKGGIYDKLMDGLSNIVSDNMNEGGYSVTDDDMNMPVSLSKMMHDSVTKAIPTLLGDILQSVQTIERGTAAESKVYDFESNKLVNRKSMGKRFVTNIEKQLDEKTFGEQSFLHDKFGSILNEQMLSKFMEQVVEHSFSGKSFQISELEKNGFYKGLTRKEKNEIKKAFRKITRATTLGGKGEKEQDIYEAMRGIKLGMADPKGYIKKAMDNGTINDLVEAGLVIYDKDTQEYTIHRDSIKQLNKNHLGKTDVFTTNKRSRAKAISLGETDRAKLHDTLYAHHRKTGVDAAKIEDTRFKTMRGLRVEEWEGIKEKLEAIKHKIETGEIDADITESLATLYNNADKLYRDIIGTEEASIIEGDLRVYKKWFTTRFTSGETTFNIHDQERYDRILLKDVDVSNAERKLLEMEKVIRAEEDQQRKYELFNELKGKKKALATLKRDKIGSIVNAEIMDKVTSGKVEDLKLHGENYTEDRGILSKLAKAVTFQYVDPNKALDFFNKVKTSDAQTDYSKMGTKNFINDALIEQSARMDLEKGLKRTSGEHKINDASAAINNLFNAMPDEFSKQEALRKLEEERADFVSNSSRVQIAKLDHRVKSSNVASRYLIGGKSRARLDKAIALEEEQFNLRKYLTLNAVRIKKEIDNIYGSGLLPKDKLTEATRLLAEAQTIYLDTYNGVLGKFAREVYKDKIKPLEKDILNKFKDLVNREAETIRSNENNSDLKQSKWRKLKGLGSAIIGEDKEAVRGVDTKQFTVAEKLKDAINIRTERNTLFEASHTTDVDDILDFNLGGQSTLFDEDAFTTQRDMDVILEESNNHLKNIDINIKRMLECQDCDPIDDITQTTVDDVNVDSVNLGPEEETRTPTDLRNRAHWRGGFLDVSVRNNSIDVPKVQDTVNDERSPGFVEPSTIDRLRGSISNFTPSRDDLAVLRILAEDKLTQIPTQQQISESFNNRKDQLTDFMSDTFSKLKDVSSDTVTDKLSPILEKLTKEDDEKFNPNTKHLRQRMMKPSFKELVITYLDSLTGDSKEQMELTEEQKKLQAKELKETKKNANVKSWKNRLSGGILDRNPAVNVNVVAKGTYKRGLMGNLFDFMRTPIGAMITKMGVGKVVLDALIKPDSFMGKMLRKTGGYLKDVTKKILFGDGKTGQVGLVKKAGEAIVDGVRGILSYGKDAVTKLWQDRKEIAKTLGEWGGKFTDFVSEKWTKSDLLGKAAIAGVGTVVAFKIAGALKSMYSKGYRLYEKITQIFQREMTEEELTRKEARDNAQDIIDAILQSGGTSERDYDHDYDECVKKKGKRKCKALKKKRDRARSEKGKKKTSSKIKKTSTSKKGVKGKFKGMGKFGKVAGLAGAVTEAVSHIPGKTGFFGKAKGLFSDGLDVVTKYGGKAVDLVNDSTSKAIDIVGKTSVGSTIKEYAGKAATFATEKAASVAKYIKPSMVGAVAKTGARAIPLAGAAVGVGEGAYDLYNGRFKNAALDAGQAIAGLAGGWGLPAMMTLDAMKDEYGDNNNKVVDGKVVDDTTTTAKAPESVVVGPNVNPKQSMSQPMTSSPNDKKIMLDDLIDLREHTTEEDHLKGIDIAIKQLVKEIRKDRKDAWKQAIIAGDPDTASNHISDRGPTVLGMDIDQIEIAGKASNEAIDRITELSKGMNPPPLPTALTSSKVHEARPKSMEDVFKVQGDPLYQASHPPKTWGVPKTYSSSSEIGKADDGFSPTAFVINGMDYIAYQKDNAIKYVKDVDANKLVYIDGLMDKSGKLIDGVSLDAVKDTLTSITDQVKGFVIDESKEVMEMLKATDIGKTVSDSATALSKTVFDTIENPELKNDFENAKENISKYISDKVEKSELAQEMIKDGMDMIKSVQDYTAKTIGTKEELDKLVDVTKDKTGELMAGVAEGSKDILDTTKEATSTLADKLGSLKKTLDEEGVGGVFSKATTGVTDFMSGLYGAITKPPSDDEKTPDKTSQYGPRLTNLPKLDEEQGTNVLGTTTENVARMTNGSTSSYEDPTVGVSYEAKLKQVKTSLPWLYQNLGKPYSWGKGKSISATKMGYLPGYDCSGLSWSFYKRRGINIPQGAHNQFVFSKFKHGKNLADAKPGDLLWFNHPTKTANRKWMKARHVGIYVGDGWMVHSSSSGHGTALTKVFMSPSYKKYFVGYGTYVGKDTDKLSKDRSVKTSSMDPYKISNEGDNELAPGKETKPNPFSGFLQDIQDKGIDGAAASLWKQGVEKAKELRSYNPVIKVPTTDKNYYDYDRLAKRREDNAGKDDGTEAYLRSIGQDPSNVSKSPSTYEDMFPSFDKTIERDNKYNEPKAKRLIPETKIEPNVNVTVEPTPIDLDYNNKSLFHIRKEMEESNKINKKMHDENTKLMKTLIETVKGRDVAIPTQEKDYYNPRDNHETYKENMMNLSRTDFPTS